MTATAEQSPIVSIQKDLRGCQFGRALWHAQQHYEANPDSALAKSYYGRLLATARRDFDAGLSLCRSAARAGEDHQLEVNLAWVLFLAGHCIAARTTIKSALLQRPDSSEAHELLHRLERQMRERREDRSRASTSGALAEGGAQKKGAKRGAKTGPSAVVTLENQPKPGLMDRIRDMVSERLASTR